ncbi:dehydrogenase [Marivivens niveibacter]|uniref:Dehydrogenase n=1 Tax=Marivivens niveibacter TaxID=1930667 RepID=A0A251WW33_9RHOB|nr:Gfo/Idh/MocA family oxidoreductase [Marivivens niveibacter]OUD08556.1 dehydrogenase [Marivivens niveibacter]
MKLGLVGYGFGGRVFHEPFIDAADGVEVAAVVARSPDKIAQINERLPDVPVFASLTELIDAKIVDMVTITTPPETHKPLALEAINAGLHVICDKPFAPTLDDAREMAQAAKDNGVLLNVFHNRRWDTDFRTAKHLIDTGQLGDIWRVHNRMDFDDWVTLEVGPGGGLLRDLGSHVIDQMLFQFGPAAAVDAQVEYVDLPGGTTDASFVVHVRHKSGVHSYISASKINYFTEREIRVYGSKGCFVVNGTDVQAGAAINGKRPADDPENWGIEPKEAWGTLYTEGKAETVPSVQSRIYDLYTQFAHDAQTGGKGPVPIETAIHTVAVLDAARAAARTGKTVILE